MRSTGEYTRKEPVAMLRKGDDVEHGDDPKKSLSR